MVDLLGLLGWLGLFSIAIEIKVEGRNSFRKQKPLNFKKENHLTFFKSKWWVFAWCSTQKRSQKREVNHIPHLMFTVILRGLGPCLMYESRATRCAFPLQMNIICISIFIKSFFYYMHICVFCRDICIHSFVHHCLTRA